MSTFIIKNSRVQFLKSSVGLLLSSAMGRDSSGFFLSLASLFVQAQLFLVVILTDFNFLTFEQSELPRLLGDKRMRAVLHVIILMFEYL